MLLALALLPPAAPCVAADPTVSVASPRMRLLWQCPAGASNGLQEFIAATGTVFDGRVTSDGNGSLLIPDVCTATLYPLYTTGPLQVSNVRLIYQAALRCELEHAAVWLDVRCHFPGDPPEKFDFASGPGRDVATNGLWVTKQLDIEIPPGRRPDNVTLGVAIEMMGGKMRGRLWIDDVRLYTTPLR